ncbi:MAG: hypothetical protein GBAus27B_000601 [Mycoplasmataceae bacterium]|nr:MAG: hypothetical protein GBAus27B_000601 [Mycoplasmataceae bacterium]
MNLTRETQDKILIKKRKEDKNGRDYLILELEKDEVVFVFDNKDTPQANWHQLEEGEEYLFTIKEGKIGTNLLIHFEKVDFII